MLNTNIDHNIKVVAKGKSKSRMFISQNQASNLKQVTVVNQAGQVMQTSDHLPQLQHLNE